MLMEVEDRLIKTLQEALMELPAENITTKATPLKFPSIVLSNLKFKFQNAGLVENAEQEKTYLEEKFSSNGTAKIYKLQEVPLRKSVAVENPPGSPLAEKDDYVVNYENGSIVFLETPGKGKDNILVKYASRMSVMTLKTIKMKALYSIEILSKERSEADAIAEKAVKALLNAEDELAADGIEIRPLRGTLFENEEKTARIQLKYVVGKEMRTQQVVGPMEKIEITRKNV
jgi:hypothetical protein